MHDIGVYTGKICKYNTFCNQGKPELKFLNNHFHFQHIKEVTR